MKKSITTYAYDDTIGVTLVYDTGAGNHLKGRLAAVYDASGERHFSYDANGYPDYEERVVAGVSYLTGYDFDAAGNLRAMIYPTGQAVAYIADTTDPGRIGQVSLDGTTMLADALAYKPFGPPAAMTLGNSIQVHQTFDKNYQAAAISAGSVFDRGYGLDNTGNITAITDNLNPSRSQSFAYDDLNQLTGATGIYGTLAFTYDRTGNRLTGSSSQGTDTYTYVPGTNRLDTITGTQTINFDHDSQGNLIGRTFVTGPGPNTTEIPDYTYTYDGQRTAKTLTAGTTVYHYDFAGRLIAETDAAGNMVKAYIWLHGQPLAMIGAGAGGAVYYYHNDHLGTPQKMTDSTGAVVWAADYLPFGKADVTMAAVENNLRASGQYYDAETELHYNYWRFYDPGLGRYLRADPVGLLGGINPYVYVLNDPVDLVDSLGLMPNTTGSYAAALEVLDKKASKGDSEAQALYNAILIDLAMQDVQAQIKDLQFQIMADVTLSMLPLVMGLPPMPAGRNIIRDFFEGKNPKVITNKAGDKIFMTNSRKIRFDLKNTHGDTPHIHFEKFENGIWKDAFDQHRFYPKQ